MKVFDIADPFQSLSNGVSGSGLLDQAAKSIERELRDQPVARARLLQALGRTYVRRGEIKPAIDCLTEAVRILGQTAGAETETLAAMIDLSTALRNGGDVHRARETLVDAEGRAKKYSLQRSAVYAKLLLNRGRISVLESRIPAALADFERSRALYETVVGARRVEIAEVLVELATTLMWNDDIARAERTAREAIEIFKITVPPMYPDRVAAEVTLADTLYVQDRLDESASILMDALRKNTELFGPNSENVVAVLDRLAIVRYSQRRLHEAETFSRDAITRGRIRFGERHLAIANSAATLSRTLIELGRFAEAEVMLRETLSIYAETLAPDHQHIASAEYFLGELLLATNRPTEAEAVLTASMNRWKRGDAPPWRAMRSASALGEALHRQGRTAEATKYLSESLRELSTDPKADREAKDKARARAKRYLRTPLTPQ
jgi:Predicted N-acetylglucosaminyl transferase